MEEGIIPLAYLRMTIGGDIEHIGQVMTFVIRVTTERIKFREDTRDRLAGRPDTNLTLALVVPDHPGAREADLNVVDNSR